MKTGVIYARYSSDSRTERSIEGQLRVCDEYARTHDILVLNTYIDRAIEQGVITNTTTRRLKDLEEQLANLDRQITIEKSQTELLLNETEIRNYYKQALELEPRLLINMLVKKIILYSDKILIQFNSPIKTSPDDENQQGLFFANTFVSETYKVPHRSELIKLDYEIRMFIKV